MNKETMLKFMQPFANGFGYYEFKKININNEITINDGKLWIYPKGFQVAPLRHFKEFEQECINCGEKSQIVGEEDNLEFSVQIKYNIIKRMVISNGVQRRKYDV